MVYVCMHVCSMVCVCVCGLSVYIICIHMCVAVCVCVWFRVGNVKDLVKGRGRVRLRK